MEEIWRELGEAVQAGDAPGTEELTRRALDAGNGPLEIMEQGLMPAMESIGACFRQGEVFVPEVLVAARAMQAGMAQLRPLLAEGEQSGPMNTVIIGTVQGDIHDIGKNMVAMLLEGAGFQVVDLGVDTSPQGFVQAIQDNQASLLALSALLTTTMPVFQQVISAVEEAGLRDKVKIMVGGAPVTEEYARKVGADGFGADAPTAVEEARRLLGG